MIEYYLMFKICFGSACFVIKDVHDDRLITFKTAQDCVAHALKEGEDFTSNRGRAIEYACIPIQGA